MIREEQHLVFAQIWQETAAKNIKRVGNETPTVCFYYHLYCTGKAKRKQLLLTNNLQLLVVLQIGFIELCVY